MSTHTHLRSSLLVVLALPLFACTANAGETAKDIAQLVPENALLYVGWAGCDRTFDTAANTAIGQILADPQVALFKKELITAIDQLIQKAAAKKGNLDQYQHGKTIITALCERPGGLSVMEAGLGPMGPAVEAALISHVGQDGETFLADFRAFLEAIDGPPVSDTTIAERPMHQLLLPVPGGAYFGVVDEYFVFTMGIKTTQQTIALIQGTGESLAKSGNFIANRKRIGGSDATRLHTFHVDLQGVVQRVRLYIPLATISQPQMLPVIENILDVIGVDALHSVTCEMHARGKGLYSASFVRLSNRERGLFSLRPTTKLTKEDLVIVPKNPTWLFACNVDMGGIYRWAVSHLGKFTQQGGQNLTEMLREVETYLGVKLDEDIFDLAGETMMVFDLGGGISPSGMTSIVASVDSKTPTRLTESFHRIVNHIREKSNGDAPIRISARDYKGHKIEYLDIESPLFFNSPAWLVREDRVIFGLFPQSIMEFIDTRVAGPNASQSILDNPEFSESLSALGGMGNSLWYVNTKRGVCELYEGGMGLLLLARILMSDEDVHLDMANFPSKQALTGRLFPNMGASYCEDDGILMTSYGATPFAIPSLGNMQAMSMAVYPAVLLPSLMRARELAKRVVSAQQMKEISVACHLYAQEHGGAFPPDLQTLVDMDLINVHERTLEAPIDEDPTRPSYVYFAGHGTWSEPHLVLLHERRDLNKGQGVNVAFTDGRVEFIRSDRIDALLERTARALENATP